MASAQLNWAEAQEQLEYIGDITVEELKKHNTKDDCWCSLKGYVYNMTPYLAMHPGGSKIIVACGGGDMTDKFMKFHSYLSPELISKIKIGKLVQ